MLGIPGFSWLLLRERKARLGNDEVRQQFGFLYRGYRRETYFWECVVMLRKVGIIFIAVFLSGAGAMV